MNRIGAIYLEWGVIGRWADQVSGTLICIIILPPAGLVYFSSVNPDAEDQNILIGRLIDETAYGREKKELIAGSSKTDVYRFDYITFIGEVKKSSRLLKVMDAVSVLPKRIGCPRSAPRSWDFQRKNQRKGNP